MKAPEIVTLSLTDMANGGAALGRDEARRVIFVPFAIPGEQVRAEVVEDHGRFAQARLLEVLETSPERTEPRCPHFGVCGGCAFQHITYEAQLRYKQNIVRDQLQRIGGLGDVDVRPTLANDNSYEYRVNVTFFPTPEGGLGFWSPYEKQVIPIRECHIIRPELLELYQDIDLELPGLRSLTLRQGDDGALLVGMAVNDVEPPELNTDFPVSVAMVLPDGQAANLVGDNYIVQTVRGRDFRVSAGCFFYPDPQMTDLLVRQVQEMAALTGRETVLDAYAGVGTLAAFLAPDAAAIHAIEANPDAVADAALNLADTENVAFYEGLVEEILPLLEVQADVVVVDPPPAGLPKDTVEQIVAHRPARLIYISDDVATLARDGKQLARQGYRPVVVQPLDMYPQSYQIQTVSLWQQ